MQSDCPARYAESRRYELTALRWHHRGVSVVPQKKQTKKTSDTQKNTCSTSYSTLSLRLQHHRTQHTTRYRHSQGVWALSAVYTLRRPSAPGAAILQGVRGGAPPTPRRTTGALKLAPLFFSASNLLRCACRSNSLASAHLH